MADMFGIGVRAARTRSALENTTARIAAGGLATVLILLTAFAGYTAVHTRSLTAAVSRQTALVNAYGRARFAIGEQEALVLRYESMPSAEAQAQVVAAGGQVRAGLIYVEQHGAPRDRRLASSLLRGTRVYMSAAAQMFNALGAGQPVRARAIESEFEAVYPLVESLILQATKTNEARSTRALRSLRASEHFILRWPSRRASRCSVSSRRSSCARGGASTRRSVSSSSDSPTRRSSTA